MGRLSFRSAGKGHSRIRTATMSHRGGYNRINVTSWRLLTQAWRRAIGRGPGLEREAGWAGVAPRGDLDAGAFGAGDNRRVPDAGMPDAEMEAESRATDRLTLFSDAVVA